MYPVNVTVHMCVCVYVFHDAHYAPNNLRRCSIPYISDGSHFDEPEETREITDSYCSIVPRKNEYDSDREITISNHVMQRIEISQ